jgi:hypothetical protein
MKSLLPTKLFLLFIFVTQFVGSIYVAWSLSPPIAFDLLYTIAFLWLIGNWFLNDIRQTGSNWPFLDLGMFLWLFWFAVIPYYLFSTRGIRGMFGVLAFISALLAGWLAAVIFVYLVWL